MTQDLTRSRTCDSLELHLTTLTSSVAGAVYIKIIQFRMIEWKAPECKVDKNAFYQKCVATISIFDYKQLQPFYPIWLNWINWIGSNIARTVLRERNFSVQCSSQTIYKHFCNHKKQNQPQESNRLENDYVLSISLSRDFI